MKVVCCYMDPLMWSLKFVLELFISSTAGLQGNIFSYSSLIENGFFYSSLTNKQCKFTMRSIYNTYQWGRKACLLYHWKRNKIINRPLGNKTIGKKIRFGSFILKDVFVVMNASVGHQTKKTTFVTTVQHRFK